MVTLTSIAYLEAKAARSGGRHDISRTIPLLWHTGGTDHIMTNTTRRRSWLRPQVYVRVEFGLSWGADQPQRNHEVAYRSRGPRERLPPFPRQVPAPNTNYLSNTTHNHAAVPYDWDMYHGYYAPPAYHLEPTHHLQQPQHAEPRRSSRSESRSSHERGQSAPPPFANNAWDVNVSQAQQVAYQTPRAGRSTRQPPEVWKALPEVPSHFRLGEDSSVPWGTWSVPYGYDAEAHPQDDEHHRPSITTTVAGPSGSNVASATSPTEVSTFSPGPSGPGFRPDDPGRVQELEALGAALMTVDNGFENQWWYQGQREAVAAAVAGEEETTMMMPGAERSSTRISVGWAVASTASSSRRDRFSQDRFSVATTEVVSPLPAFVSPDSAGVHSPLSRSLSTRSDELFFTERRRGGGLSA